MAGYWLKLYTEIIDDPKYHRLSDQAKIGMIELMVVAKKCNRNGELPSIEDICFYTRRPVEWWGKVIAELEKIEFVINSENSVIIRKFAERQKAVNEAERQKLSREIRHRKEFSHEPVTGLSRNVTESREEKEVELELEKEEDVDVDVPATGAGIIDDPENSWVRESLITQFEQVTGLTAPISQSKVMEKWIDAFARLEKMGATPEIWRQAVTELTAKRYRIAGPWSIEKPCAMILAERKRETIPKSERRRDSDGEFRDFIKR